MKKAGRILIGILLIIVTLSAIVACGETAYKVEFIVEGSLYHTEYVSGNDVIPFPQNPQKTGYIFIGWFADDGVWEDAVSATRFKDKPIDSDLKVYARYIFDGHEHEYVDQLVLPTCDKGGYTEHKCACGASYKDNEVSKKGHSYTRYLSNNDATYESDGTKTAYCDNGCGTMNTITDVGSMLIPGHVHAYNKKVIENAYVKSFATCKEKAVYFYSCDCGAKGNETFKQGDVLPHIYATYVYNNDAKCNQNGTETAYCTRGCGECDVREKTGSALTHSFTQYVSNNDATYESDGTKTAKCEHGCGEEDTIPDVGSMLIMSKIAFKTLSVSGSNVSGIFANSKEEFDFTKEVETSGEASYVVSFDKNGEQTISTKKVNLALGDNKFYVIELIGGEVENIYTITIRRRPIHIVSFETLGGTSVASQNVEEGECAVAPTTIKNGYDFVSWNYDFAKPIMGEITISASWRPRTDTPYIVEYYLENVDNDKYTKVFTDNLKGVTDGIANAEIKSYDHFTFNSDKSIISGKIDAQGNLVLEVYYTRNLYTVTFDGNSGEFISGELSQTVKYEGNATAPTFKKEGYTLTGFNKPLTNVSASFTATANWQINQYTITIVYGNGQPDKVITQNYDTEISFVLPSKVEKAGYEFKGWDGEIPNRMPSKNLIISAIFGKEDNLSYILKGGKITITGFSTGKEETNLLIPSKIDGCDVYAISSGAFKGSDVETVTIEPGLEKIYDDAFRNCLSLDTVTFKSGSTVTYIGDSVFRGCETLSNITLPNSIESVGELVFYGCSQVGYGELYSKNVQAKEYFAPKYTYEFLGQDVMPIGGYIEPSVGYFATGVTVDNVMKDYVASGTNILIGIQQARFGTTSEHYKQMYESLEKYGGMMIERYKVPNAEYLYASYAGSHTEDEPGVVQWRDDLYYNSPYASGNQVGKQHVEHENWKENHPRKLRFTNLLPINSPKNAFVFGTSYYGYNNEKNHDKFNEYTAKFANYDEYYKTYIEEMKPEVFCYDFYPLWENGGKGYLSYPELNGRHFEQLAVTRYYAEDYNDKVNGGYVPFWNFIQISAWGAQGEGKGGSRPATERELNWQANTALAYGSKGYIYFVFNDYGDITGNGNPSDYAGTTPINIDGTKNTPVYNNVKKLNTQSQAMAKWLLNANVDHIYVYGANPNGEATPTSVLTPRNNSINWAFKDSVGVNHIVSHMTYYANNNEYDEGVMADVRELYFICNNGTQSTSDGNITINFKTAVSGSYIYNGVEKTFSGTSLTVNTVAGEGFAILLDK